MKIIILLTTAEEVPFLRPIIFHKYGKLVKTSSRVVRPNNL